MTTSVTNVKRIICDRGCGHVADCLTDEEVTIDLLRHDLRHASRDALGLMVKEQGVDWNASMPGMDVETAARKALHNNKPFFYFNGNILTTINPDHMRPVCMAADVPNAERK